MADTTYDIDYFRSERNSTDVSYTVEQTYNAIPGTCVRVLLEFPDYTINSKTAIIVLDDVMTLSYSSHRVKAPVNLIGRTNVAGYGLGNRVVAGTMVRSVFTTDKLTEFQTQVYLEDQENIKNRLLGIDNSLPSGLPMEDQISIMQDDLTAFNIHAYAITEETTLVDSKYSASERFETITGCTIMNTGQIFSIQDLITESTFSFQAKAVRASTNITNYNRGYSTNSSTPTISSLLNKYYNQTNQTKLG